MTKNERLRVAGTLCRRIRVLLGISVSEMARIAGYSAGTISQFEKGENNNLYLYLIYRGLEKEYGENTTDATNLESSDR